LGHPEGMTGQGAQKKKNKSGKPLWVTKAGKGLEGKKFEIIKKTKKTS